MPKRILIVDDDENICALVEAALRKDGFEVSVAHSQEQAYRFLARTTFDVLLLASFLPDGNGLRLCDEVRERWGTDAVIIVTATERAQAKPVVAFELGADDFVVMPFEFTELTLRIAAHLRRKRDGA